MESLCAVALIQVVVAHSRSWLMQWSIHSKDTPPGGDNDHYYLDVVFGIEEVAAEAREVSQSRKTRVAANEPGV